MIIKTIPIDEINPAPYNPRKDLKPGDPEYEKLKKSMAEFDLVEPLVWNKKSGNLVGGHQRLKVLKEQGKTEVEVSVVNLTDPKEKALNLALNKISGEWDLPLLKDILEELDTGAFDIEITGFDSIEIEQLMTQFHVPEEGLTDDDAVPEAVESVCKPGDLWILGNHRLLCGDATILHDVEKLMGGEKADMVFTDPPYGMDLDTDYSSILGSPKSMVKGKGIRGNKYRSVIGDNVEFDPSFLLSYFMNVSEIFMWGADYYAKYLPPGAWFVWDKCTTKEGIVSEGAEKMIGSSFELCWSKQKHKREIARLYQRGFCSVDNSTKVCPTQKPVQLAEWFIGKFSKLNDKIIDLFGGSGSTLIACEKLGRKCYMMEISEMYCDVIINRWENYTGKKAELL